MRLLAEKEAEAHVCVLVVLSSRVTTRLSQREELAPNRRVERSSVLTDAAGSRSVSAAYKTADECLWQDLAPHRL